MAHASTAMRSTGIARFGKTVAMTSPTTTVDKDVVRRAMWNAVDGSRMACASTALTSW